MRRNNIESILLKAIFGYKRNFAKGHFPPDVKFGNIELAPFKNNAGASASISADFELSWAFRGRPFEYRKAKAENARRNFDYLLSLFEDFQVPITWATVGHLFLNCCDRNEKGIAHNDMPRPSINRRWEGDWYKHDPCTDIKKDPLWYATDLIEKIINSKIEHEIGTHTFSHIEFSSEGINDNLVGKEIQKSKEAMQRYGLVPRSLVFPFNIINYDYLDLFHREGIVAVRHRDKMVRLSYPERTNSGVYKIYESMNLRIPEHYDYLSKAIIFIEKAIERKASYHIWFHPSDPIEYFKYPLQAILNFLSKERNKNNIWITTMYDLASYCEIRRNLALLVNKKGNRIVVNIEKKYDQQKYFTPEMTYLVKSNTRITPSCMFSQNNPNELKKVEIRKESLNQYSFNLPIDTTYFELTMVDS